MSDPTVVRESELPPVEPATAPLPAPAPAPEAGGSAIDWPLRQANPVRRFLNWLEGVNLAIEKPIARLVREPQFNPLYHTGTITVLALLVILVTGVYLTMFFQFGFEESYAAVARMETSLVGRVIRALHRYASVVALIAAVLHGWRTFFMDRFRGPRWLAWVTGIVMAALVWAAGVTGYWLVFDERAQILNQTLVNLLDGFAGGVAFLNRLLLTEAAGTGWLMAMLLLVTHLILSLVIAVGFILHIKRLRRAKILPPRPWIAVFLGLLVVAAVLVPAGMLAPANPQRLPGKVPIDLFYLAYLPAALHLSPGLFWGGATLLLVVMAAVPWLLLRKPLKPIVVHEEDCTGCTLCAADCPYKAITLVERPEGSAHKYLAVVDPKLCVSCGICIGSCRPLALTLGDRPIKPLWQDTVNAVSGNGRRPVKVVFTCERHATHGAKAYLRQPERSYFRGKGRRQSARSAGGNGHGPQDMHVEVIPLTCIGMAHPDLAKKALAAGAAEVQFVGCPPEDCANREGNLWMQERLDRKRLPRLRRELMAAPITADWQPPNDFPRALKTGEHQTVATGYSANLGSMASMVPAVLLLAGVFVVTILLTRVNYRPYPAGEAAVQITMSHRSGYPVQGSQAEGVPAAMPGLSPTEPVRLVLEVDGEPVLDETYPVRKQGEAPVQAVEQLRLPAGERHLRLLMFDQPGQVEPQVLFDQWVPLQDGQALPLAIADARLGSDPVNGRKLFTASSLGTHAGCPICHSLEPDVKLVGPSLAGIGTRAAQRVPGMSAEDYIHQSIVAPSAYVVEGFPAGQMPPNLAETLEQDEIDDLVAFLLTLR